MRKIDPSKLEPNFNSTDELGQLQLHQALTWYSQNKVAKDAILYSISYFKKHYPKSKVEYVLRTKYSSTLGFTCRIIERGGTLPKKSKLWFDSIIQEVLNTKIKEPEAPKIKTNVLSIQDHIRKKSSEVIGELEGQIDDLILSNFTITPSPHVLMDNMEVKSAHLKYITEHFKLNRSYYDNVLLSSDPQINEGFANFNKPQLKKIISFCDLVLDSCGKVMNKSVSLRKPRKRKVKSSEELTSKINYQKEFKELDLISVDPKNIIGASSLWVYNTKTRKLGNYLSGDITGLFVKGSTITNFNHKSKQKTLRKPKEVLSKVIKGGKVFLRNVLSEIKATEKDLTGRINSDTILIRIIK